MHIDKIYFGDDSSIDVSIFLWDIWWVKQALLQGYNPFFTPMLYFPSGLSLYYHTLSLPQTLVALPLALAHRYLAAFNLVLLFSFVATGIAASLLIARLTGFWPGAVLGAVYFVLAPNYMTHVAGSHPNLISLHWLMFALLVLTHLGQQSTPIRRMATVTTFAFLVAASIYTDLQNAVFLAILAPMVYLMMGFRRPTLGFLRDMALGMAIALVLAVPLVAGLVRDYTTVAATSPQLVAAPVALLDHSVDLHSFVYPGGYTSSGLALYQGLLSLPRQDVPSAFVGYSAVPLIVLGSRGRKAWIAWLWAVGTVLVALGPEIRISQGITLMPNYVFKAFWKIPGISISRSPDRFEMLTVLALAILLAMGFQSLTGMASNLLQNRLLPGFSSNVSLGIFPVALLLIIAELLPLPTAREIGPQPSPELLQIFKSAGRGTLLELPRNHGTIAMLRMEYHQIAHEMPLITGYASRPQIPNLDRSERLEPQLALSTFRYLGNYEERPLWREDASGRAQPEGVDVRQKVLDLFGYFGIRYVLVDKGILKDDAEDLMKRRLNWLLQREPAAEDSNFMLYTVEAPPRSLLVDFGELWHAWEWNGSQPFRWSSGRSSLYILASEPGTVAVRFKAWSFGQPRELRIDNGAGWQQTVALDISNLRDVVLSVKVEKGLNQLVLEATGPALPEGPRGRKLSFAITDPTVAPLR